MQLSVRRLPALSAGSSTLTSVPASSNSAWLALGKAEAAATAPSAYRTAARSVFIYGFPKSAQADISAADRRDLTDFGRLLLDLGDDGIAAMIEEDELKEIECHAEE